MTGKQHAPGPWRRELRHNCFAIIDAKGQEIAFIDREPKTFEGKPCGSVTSQGRTAEELAATARLVTLAPSLLQALQALLARVEAIPEAARIAAGIYSWPEANAAQDAIQRATATTAEDKARAAGWFPTREAHIMFRNSTGVCRHLRDRETYNSEIDSYMSVPLRHADNWEAACRKDNL